MTSCREPLASFRTVGPSQESELRETLAFISHELRNPLHAITLQLAVARAMSDGLQEPQLSARLARVQALMARYSHRVTMLLDLTAPGATDLKVCPEPVDIAALLQGLAEAAQPEGRERGIELAVIAPMGLRVMLDPRLLEQIVENLVFNAFKHASCSRVTLQSRQWADRLLIEVADDGLGITEEDQARIFDQHAVARSTHRGEGKGLGLWIVRRLAQLMGGTVDVRSRPGAGTIFCVDLPFSAVEEKP